MEVSGEIPALILCHGPFFFFFFFFFSFFDLHVRHDGKQLSRGGDVVQLAMV